MQKDRADKETEAAATPEGGVTAAKDNTAINTKGHRSYRSVGDLKEHGTGGGAGLASKTQGAKAGKLKSRKERERTPWLDEINGRKRMRKAAGNKNSNGKGGEKGLNCSNHCSEQRKEGSGS